MYQEISRAKDSAAGNFAPVVEAVLLKVIMIGVLHRLFCGRVPWNAFLPAWEDPRLRADPEHTLDSFRKQQRDAASDEPASVTTICGRSTTRPAERGRTPSCRGVDASCEVSLCNQQ